MGAAETKTGKSFSSKTRRKSVLANAACPQGGSLDVKGTRTQQPFNGDPTVFAADESGKKFPQGITTPQEHRGTLRPL